MRTEPDADLLQIVLRAVSEVAAAQREHHAHIRIPAEPEAVQQARDVPLVELSERYGGAAGDDGH